MIKNVITSKKDSVDGRITATKYSRTDQVKFFTGCLSQILLGPFLNTWTHIAIIQMICLVDQLPSISM